MDGTIHGRLFGSDEERAVSPVIGVILMVAITVILAAVIAAFVMGIGPGGDSVQANFDVSGEGSNVVVSVTNAENLDSVSLGPENNNCSDTDNIASASDFQTGQEFEFDCSSGSDQRLQLIGSTEEGGEMELVDEEF